MSIRAMIRNLAPQESLGLVPRSAVRTTPATDPISPEDMKLLPAERAFAELAVSSGGLVWRAGWPDFLADVGGRRVAVEIKRGEDRISSEQARMFAALEGIGLATFIWNPRMPTAMIPWREYMAVSSRRSAAAIANSETQYKCEELSKPGARKV